MLVCRPTPVPNRMTGILFINHRHLAIRRDLAGFDLPVDRLAFADGVSEVAPKTSPC